MWSMFTTGLGGQCEVVKIELIRSCSEFCAFTSELQCPQLCQEEKHHMVSSWLFPGLSYNMLHGSGVVHNREPGK
jgi:hypothetical protein